METTGAPAVAFQLSWLRPLSLNGQAPNRSCKELCVGVCV